MLAAGSLEDRRCQATPRDDGVSVLDQPGRGALSSGGDEAPVCVVFFVFTSTIRPVTRIDETVAERT